MVINVTAENLYLFVQMHPTHNPKANFVDPQYATLIANFYHIYSLLFGWL